MDQDLSSGGPPPTPLSRSITQAGIDAGLDAARQDHPGELAVALSTADGGSVKLSLAGRFRFFKAAVFGQYTKKSGGGAGVDVAIPIGRQGP